MPRLHPYGQDRARVRLHSRNSQSHKEKEHNRTSAWNHYNKIKQTLLHARICKDYEQYISTNIQKQTELKIQALGCFSLEQIWTSFSKASLNLTSAASDVFIKTSKRPKRHPNPGWPIDEVSRKGLHPIYRIVLKYIVLKMYISI